MITVNLKDLYFWCKKDVIVEITEEMLEAIKAADRQESAYSGVLTATRRIIPLIWGGIANEWVIYFTEIYDRSCSA